MRAALWAVLTGALTAVPETEPGWVWLAGHAASSILVAYLVMCLIDVAWMRALCALAPGSYACGGVTLTAWTEEPVPPGGDPNMAVLPARPPAWRGEANPLPANFNQMINPAVRELLDAVDAHLAADTPFEEHP